MSFAMRINGTQGADGADGATGPTGPTGAQGPAGAPGTAGATGATGSTGSSGATGAAGATGAKGDKGDTGSTGTTGSAGATGAAGTPAVIGASAAAVGSTSAPTRTAGTMAVLAEMTVTITTTGGNVGLSFSGAFNVQSADAFDVALFADGTEITGTRRSVTYTSSAGVLDPVGSIGGTVVAISALVTGVSSASHTYDVRWLATGGTARAVTTQRNFSAAETAH